MEKIFNKNSFKQRYKDIIPFFKEKQTQNFTTIVLTILSLSVFGLFVINPTVSTIVQLKKQISDGQYVDNKLQEKINDLRILQQQYDSLGDKITNVLEAIPSNPSVPLLTGEVHALLLKNNLDLIRLQVLQVELANEKKTSGASSNSFVFSLDAKGNSSDITKFISSLENMKRIITIDSISITTDPENPATTQLTLHGRAYFKD